MIGVLCQETLKKDPRPDRRSKEYCTKDLQLYYSIRHRRGPRFRGPITWPDPLLKWNGPRYNGVLFINQEASIWWTFQCKSQAQTFRTMTARSMPKWQHSFFCTLAGNLKPSGPRKPLKQIQLSGLSQNIPGAEKA